MTVITEPSGVRCADSSVAVLTMAEGGASVSTVANSRREPETQQGWHVFIARLLDRTMKLRIAEPKTKFEGVITLTEMVSMETMPIGVAKRADNCYVLRGTGFSAFGTTTIGAILGWPL